jgi:hypothetical protein
MRSLIPAVARSGRAMALAGALLIAFGVRAVDACQTTVTVTDDTTGQVKVCTLITQFNNNCLYKCTIAEPLKPSTSG